jgi:hypothetical protein
VLAPPLPPLGVRAYQSGLGAIRLEAVAAQQGAGAPSEWFIHYANGGGSGDLNYPFAPGLLTVLSTTLTGQPSGVSLVCVSTRRNDGTELVPVWSYSTVVAVAVEMLAGPSSFSSPPLAGDEAVTETAS